MIPNLVTALSFSYDFRKGVMDRLLSWEVANMACALNVDFMSHEERKKQTNPLRDLFPDMAAVRDLARQGYGVTLIGKDIRLWDNSWKTRAEDAVGGNHMLNLFMVITDLNPETRLRWPTSRYVVDAYMNWPKGGSSREVLTQLESVDLCYDMRHVVDNTLTVIVPSPARCAGQDHIPVMHEEFFDMLIETVQVRTANTNGYHTSYVNLHEDAFIVHDAEIHSLAASPNLDDGVSAKFELVVAIELPVRGRNGSEYPTGGPEDMFLIMKVPL